MEASRAQLQEGRLPFTAREKLALRQLAGDFWLFATSCLYTFDEHEPDLALRLRKPFPRDEHIRGYARELVSHRLVIVDKARQMFLSWLCLAFIVWRCLFNPGERWLVVSKREADAFHLKDRVNALLKNLPEPLRFLDERVTDNSGEIEWTGGSSIHFLPASPDIGRTYTASGVLMDEFAFHPWAEAMLTSIFPTVAKAGFLFLISTHNGVGSFYNKLLQSFRDHGLHKIVADWFDDPTHTPELLEEITATLTKRRKAQEYLREPLQSGAVVFESDYLKLTEKPLTDAARKARVKEARRNRDEAPFLFGIDVAEGCEDGDRCAVQIIDKESGAQVRTLVGRWRPDVFAGKIAALAKEFSGPLGVEKNGPGGAVILELERLGLSDRIYRHKSWDQRGRVKKRLGWVTDAKSKSLMIDELEAALRKGHVRLADQETLDELQVYEFKDSAHEHSGAPEGFHDDLAIALAIAWQMRKTANRSLETTG